MSNGSQRQGEDFGAAAPLITRVDFVFSDVRLSAL
jgi:hypothetical protein